MKSSKEMLVLVCRTQHVPLSFTRFYVCCQQMSLKCWRESWKNKNSELLAEELQASGCEAPIHFPIFLFFHFCVFTNSEAWSLPMHLVSMNRIMLVLTYFFLFWSDWLRWWGWPFTTFLHLPHLMSYHRPEESCLSLFCSLCAIKSLQN